MRFERRDFIKIGTASVVGTLFHVGSGFGQAPTPSAIGQLRSGTGSLYVEGRLKSGTLRLEAQDFVEGPDRTLIAHATLDSAKLYRAMFSQDHGRVVFANIRDDEHATTLILSDTDDPEVGHLTLWNDRDAPESFRIDVKRFLKTRNQKESVLDGKAPSLDQVGKRKPPAFTSEEIEKVFGSDPAFLQFMRGRKPTYPPSVSWTCEWISFVPGCGLLHLFWEGDFIR